MIEKQFNLETTPEVERFWLHCNYNEEKHMVTMKEVEDAFAGDQVELIRILNNNSATWFLEKIY